MLDHDLVAARSAAFEIGRALPETPEATIEVARLLNEIGETNEARWLLEAASARHPESHELLIGLAETSLLVGDAASALEALERVPADSPRAARVEVLRVRAIVATGRLDEGLAALSVAELRYDQPLLFGDERVDLLQVEGRYADALRALRELQAHPGVPEAEHPRLALREAELVAKLEGAGAALPLLDAIVAADPASEEAARLRTALLVDDGRGEEALDRLERSIAVTPNADALHGLAADAAVAIGDLQRAEQHLRAQVEAAPSAQALAKLANFLHEQGRTREGAEVLAQTPEHADALQQIELRYQRIAMQIHVGDLDDSRAAIRAFGRDHPRNPRLDYLLARLDMAEDRPEAAARRLALVVSRLDRSDVNVLLAAALERSGDLEGAELRYGLVATSGGAAQLAAAAGLLRVLEAKQDWEQLAAMAYLAARYAPLRDRAALAMAHARIALGRDAEAEQILRAHLEESPDLVASRVGLSMALRRQGRVDEAATVLDAATERVRREPAWIAERATVLGLLGRAPEAIALLDAAEADGLATRELRHARLYLLFTSGRGDAALAEVERVAVVDPEDPTPHRMAADYLASTGRFEASLEPYRRALERAPAASDVTLRMAIALERSGHEAEAARAYERAIALDADAVGARNNLALILGRAGRHREAITVAQAAYARAEEEPVVIDTLASLYLEAGLARRAAAMLEKAQRLDPGSVDVPYHLALAYRELGRADEARSLLAELEGRVGGEHPLHGRIEDALATLR